MASTIVSQGQDAIQATGNALSYVWGQCTRFVAETLGWIPGGLGNAYQWLGAAQAQGLPTGMTPQPGAVAVWGQGQGMPFGHVAVVQGLIPGGIQVAEENWLGQAQTDVRNVTGSNLAGIIGYIYPPGGSAGSGGNPLGGIPVVGGVIDAGQNLASIGPAIAGLPAQVGHGLADALTGTVHDAGVWAHNMLPALIVALVVAVVLFAL